MDDSVRRLGSTTFSGRRFRRAQLEEVRRLVLDFPSLSRNELALTVCELLDWRTESGSARTYACLRMLEALEARGVLSLPAKVVQKRSARQAPRLTGASLPGEVVEARLDEIGPVSVQLVSDDADKAQWNELVERCHYLGYRKPVGPHVRYFVLDGAGRRLGCVLFQRASRKLDCRDGWIGWQDQKFKKRLGQVVGNARFVIFPWVSVPNLASHALSLATGRLAADWRERWGVEPLLVETFVDGERFSGASYRAGGWAHIGETAGGRCGRGKKQVYVKCLVTDARRLLREGPKSKPRRPAVRCAVPANDGFVARWHDFVGIIAEVAGRHDRQWRRRRRLIGTLEVMLFVFRLVFSKNRQGYQSVLNELWDNCRRLGVSLASETPPAASSMCAARGRVDAQVFREAHRRIIGRLDRDAPDSEWRQSGRRMLAVDGTKVNLPRELTECGYALPARDSHYPQGLVSCLYRLGDRMPIDFDLQAHRDERRMALAHLDHLRAGDVVVYDRGYFSFGMLDAHRLRGVDCVFRLAGNSAAGFNAFMRSGDTDRLIEQLAPSESKAREWRRDHRGRDFRPMAVRCVHYRAGGTDFYLATTLTDTQRFPVDLLADLYHGRWGLEELYKSSKTMIEVEQFHARTERGVRQEIYAHFTLLALARTFGGHLESALNAGCRSDAVRRTNFKNALTTVAGHFEALMLGHVRLVAETINGIFTNLSRCMSKERPGRHYPRLSKRPDDRFRNANRKTKPA